jgi:hypothetical protein
MGAIHTGPLIDRRLAATALAVAVLLASGVAAHAWSTSPRDAAAVHPAGDAAIQGDADCSGAVNPIDSLAILRQDGGIGDVACPDRADTNCDDAVDPVDSLRILRFDAGLPLAAISGCTPIGEPLVDNGAATSEDLINQALADGDIDEATATVYRLYAAYGDDALPAQYKAASENAVISYSGAQAGDSYDTLSPAQKSAVDPYLLPPSAPGSWYDLKYGAPMTYTEPAEIGPALVGISTRFWVHDSANQEQIIEQLGILVDQVGPALTSLMESSPLSDLQAAFNGGSGDLDIYVVPDLEVGAQVSWSEPPGCSHEAVYIALDEDLFDAAPALGFPAPLVSPATQGLLSAIGASFPLLDCLFSQLNSLMLNMTAALAESIAFPSLNPEFAWDEVFSRPDRSVLSLRDGGKSLWPLLRGYSESLQGAVADLWHLLATKDALGALNSLAGGLAEQFPEFGKQLWNRPPVDQLAQEGMEAKAPSLILAGLSDSGLFNNISLSGEPDRDYSLTDDEMENLSVLHYHMKILDAEMVEISNLLRDYQDSAMTLLVKHKLQGRTTYGADGGWEEMDLTNMDGVSFCRALPGQDVEEIVVIMTRFDATDPEATVQLADGPLVEAHDSCGWVGTLEAHGHFDRFDVGQDYALDFSVIGTDIVFGPVPGDNGSDGSQRFEVNGGTLSYQIVGHLSGAGFSCTINGSKVVEVEAGEGYLEVTETANGVDYVLFGEKERIVTWFQDCTSGGDSTYDMHFWSWACSGGTRSSATPTLIEGTYEFTSLKWRTPHCPGFSPPNIPGGNEPVDESFEWSLHR